MSDPKTPMEHIEASKLPSRMGDDQQEIADALARYTPGSAEEKKLLRKIDLHLMPILWIMYVLNYVDRTNIGNAKIAGMGDDLKLDDQRM
jgi:hypothetical protein